MVTARSGIARIEGQYADCIINPMDSEIIFAIEESPEGGYEARALGYSIFTQGDSPEELREMVRDAVHCFFEPEDTPEVIRVHFVHDEVISARSCRAT